MNKFIQSKNNQITQRLWAHVGAPVGYYYVSGDVDQLKTDMICSGYKMINVPEEFALRYRKHYYEYAMAVMSNKNRVKEIVFVPDEFIELYPEMFMKIAERARINSNEAKAYAEQAVIKTNNLKIIEDVKGL